MVLLAQFTDANVVFNELLNTAFWYTALVKDGFIYFIYVHMRV